MATDVESLASLLENRIVLCLRQVENGEMLKSEARQASSRAKNMINVAYEELEGWDKIAREAGIKVPVVFKGVTQGYGYGR